MQQDRHIIRNNIAVPRIVICSKYELDYKKARICICKRKIAQCRGNEEFMLRQLQSLPMASHFSLAIRPENDDIPCILVTSHVWACTDSHLTVKSQPTYLFLEPFNQSRSTNTTPFVPASMAANKDIGPVDSLRRSRKPLSILHKYFFNKVVDVKMSQTSASIMLQIEK